MARSQKNAQKKRQQKALKRKQKLEQRQPKQRLSKEQFLIQRIKHQQSAPIYKSLMSHNLLETGIGTVLFSRKLSTGEIAACGLIVDLDTFGVKDAFYSCLPESDFENALEKQSEKVGKLIEAHPALIRKMVEGAIEHAATLGHQPHPEYVVAKTLFENIQITNCDQTFQFGHYQKNLDNQKNQKVQAIKEEVLHSLKAHYQVLFSE